MFFCLFTILLQWAVNFFRELEMKKLHVDNIINLMEDKLSVEEINDCANSNFYLDKLKSKMGANIYSLLILSLTHEEFSEKIARKYWFKIIHHMKKINALLGRNVGISVAAMDYLSNIKGILARPRIISEEKSIALAETCTKDELTDLLERKAFNVYLDKEISRFKREKAPLSFMMLDVDNFKKVNDFYGHQKGDTVLHELGVLIKTIVREMDLAARYGGEELSIIMPNTTIHEASLLAERLRLKIERHDFDGVTITISIGLSEMSSFVDTKEQLIKTADDALYAAKSEGKNKVVCFH